MARTQNADGSVTIGLAYPIKSEGDMITSITLRRPKGKDYRRFNVEKLRGDGDEQLRAIGSLAGLAPSSCDLLDASDIVDCMPAIISFFEKPNESGDAS
jgi:hypothetical protein